MWASITGVHDIFAHMVSHISHSPPVLDSQPKKKSVHADVLFSMSTQTTWVRDYKES